MDICIFGGAFDPVHKGHIAIAQSAVKRFNFDKLLFMVSKEPPHKSNHTASFTHRLNMVKLALNGLGSKFDVTDIEAKLNDLSYTYNSLSALKEIYPNDNIYFLVGSDIFASIEKWYNYKKLFDLAYFIIGCRPGNSFKNMIERDYISDVKKITDGIEKEYSDENNNRKINIDPAILTLENFILVTNKNFTHRIYLKDGVFADLTLIYKKKKGYTELEWTYADYSSDETKKFLNKIRELFYNRLIESSPFGSNWK